jgi:TolB-like protein/Tfp pilus assembly protein PilF
MLLHYRLLEKLGEGGMGVVWKALDTKLDREVALKILPEEMASDPERFGRFEREAKAVAALNHPNIVTVHSVEETEGSHFITMELVRGKSLTELIPKYGLHLGKFFELSVALADAIGAAHQRGITHRDLKPDNVMVDEDGRLKVLDFGLAKLREEARTTEASTQLPTATVTQEGKILGTVSYMSPEQAEGKATDNRSDIFSLGVMLYQMATGQRPFKGDTHISIISSIMKDTPASVTDIKASLPNHLGRIIRRCLAKDPKSRYQSTLDLRNELEELGREVATGETTPVKQTAAPMPAIKSMVWLAGAALVVLLLAVIAVQQWRGRRPAERQAETGDAISVAVLPFANMSPDEQNEYFSDGMTEELINALVKVEGLRVPARTSVFALKGAGLDIHEIGERLGVDHVLEGSVRKAGDQIRITAQLVKVDDGFHLWSESYDRRMDDVFAIQEEIAQAIVGNLRIRLEGSKGGTLVAGPTENLEAYNLYLQGRHQWNRRTADGLEKAIDLFQRAVEADSGFALAWSGLADSYLISPDYRGSPKEEVYPKAKEAAMKALAADDSLAEAHTSLAQVLYYHDHDWDAAEREFQRALELNPRYATTHHWYGLFLMKARNRPDDCIAHFRQAELLDPLSRIIKSGLGTQLYEIGRFDEGIEKNREVIQLDPDFAGAHGNLAKGLLGKQMFEEAIRTLEGFRADGAIERDRMTMLAEANHLLGRHRRELEVALEARGKYPEGAQEIAMEAHAHAALGELDEVRRLFDEVLQIPDLPSGEALISIASELLAHGHEGAARELFERTIEWYHGIPEVDLTDLSLPYALHALDRTDEAALHLERLVQLPPEERVRLDIGVLDFLGASGWLATLRGDREEALRIVDRLAELNRPTPRGDNTAWQAGILTVMGDRDRAVERWREAMAQGWRFGRFQHAEMTRRSLWDYPPYRRMLEEKGLPLPVVK